MKTLTPQSRQHIRFARCVWALLTRDPHASIRSIADELGMSKTGVAYAIDTLEAAGYVEPCGYRKRARRIIVPFVVASIRCQDYAAS